MGPREGDESLSNNVPTSVGKREGLFRKREGNCEASPEAETKKRQPRKAARKTGPNRKILLEGEGSVKNWLSQGGGNRTAGDRCKKNWKMSKRQLFPSGQKKEEVGIREIKKGHLSRQERH